MPTLSDAERIALAEILNALVDTFYYQSTAIDVISRQTGVELYFDGEGMHKYVLELRKSIDLVLRGEEVDMPDWPDDHPVYGPKPERDS